MEGTAMDDVMFDDIGPLRDSPGLAQAVRGALEIMAGSDSPELRELATEVLAGRTTLRRAMLSGAYRDQVSTAGERFAEWYCELDPAEREACVAAGRAALRDSAAPG
jgi:hypothetical protein